MHLRESLITFFETVGFVAFFIVGVAALFIGAIALEVWAEKGLDILFHR